MPEYEYRCRDCKQTISIQRSMSVATDESVGNCSYCGSIDLVRIWGASFVAARLAEPSRSASPGAQSQMCASNPSQPKSCCPCSASTGN